jgi:hypothetical protein
MIKKTEKASLNKKETSDSTTQAHNTIATLFPLPLQSKSHHTHHH